MVRRHRTISWEKKVVVWRRENHPHYSEALCHNYIHSIHSIYYKLANNKEPMNHKQTPDE